MVLIPHRQMVRQRNSRVRLRSPLHQLQVPLLRLKPLPSPLIPLPSAAILLQNTTTFSTSDLTSSCDRANYPHLDLCPFLSSSPFSVNITNTGTVGSDYVALAFVSGDFGPEPRPRKSLVSYKRLFGIGPGESQTAELVMNLGGLARHDEQGNQVLYPGTYRIEVDVPMQVSWDFVLEGGEVVLDEWPQQ
jgi:xylan 1,4-beta-xylosidase